jgi:hypothetical protein
VYTQYSTRAAPCGNKRRATHSTLSIDYPSIDSSSSLEDGPQLLVTILGDLRRPL